MFVDYGVPHHRGSSIRWFESGRHSLIPEPLNPVEVLIGGEWIPVTPETAKLPDDWRDWTDDELRTFRRKANRPALTNEQERAAFLISGTLPAAHA